MAGWQDAPLVSGWQQAPVVKSPGVGAFAKRGLARGLGAPVDLVNAGLGLVGLGRERPFFGSKTWQQTLDETFGGPSAPEGAKPTTFPEAMAGGAAEAVGSLLPGAVIVKGLSAGKGLAGYIARRIGETFARQPASAVAGTAVAGAGAGIGGQAAVQLTDDERARIFGELAGGFAAAPLGAAPGAALRATDVTLSNVPLGVGKVYRAAKAGLFPFTRGGAEVRARARVQGLVADPDVAAARMAEPTIADVSPATRSGEPALMALEREVLNTDPKLAAEFAGKSREATDKLRQEISEIAGGGQVEETRQFLGQRLESTTAGIEANRQARQAATERQRGITTGLADVDAEAAARDVAARSSRLLNALNIRADQARAVTEQRLAALSPTQRKSEAAVIVREEIENALTAANNQARELWEAVPMDIQVPTNTGRAAYGELVAKTPQAQQDSIPDKARRFLDPDSNQKFGDAESVREVWGLRSDLLETAREARAAGKFNAARMADDLADALLSDLGAVQGETAGAVGQPLREALDFSRVVAERFRRGAVGKILGTERAGGERIAPEMTLEATVGAGGTRGAVAASQIAAAAPTSQAAKEGTRQYLLNRLQDVAVKGSAFNQVAARKFVTDNADMLDQYPALRQEIEGVASSADLSDRIGATMASRSKRVTRAAGRLTAASDAEGRAVTAEAERTARETAKLTDRQAFARTTAVEKKSYVSAFLNAPVEQEFDVVLKAKNPVAAASALKRSAQKDQSGRALAGLKASFADYLIRRASTKAGDLSGLDIVLNDSRMMAGAREFMAPDDIMRLRRIAGELKNIETAAGPLPSVGKAVISDVPSTILSLAARTLAAGEAAKVAKHTGGHGLIIAGMFTKRAQQLLTNLTRDRAKALLTEAVQDQELFKTLLTTTATQMGRKAVNMRLNTWLEIPGRTFLENQDETSR